MHPLVFLIGCIGTRFAISAIAFWFANDETLLKYMGILALVPAIGFLTIYMMGWRKTGVEAGGKIWWNGLRPIHGILWLTFAALAITGYKHAWFALFADTVIGLAAWMHHHQYLL